MKIRLKPSLHLFYRLELVVSIRKEWPGGLPGKTWRHFGAALHTPVGYSLEYHVPFAARLRFGKHHSDRRAHVYLGPLYLFADVGCKPRKHFEARQWGPLEWVWH